MRYRSEGGVSRSVYVGAAVVKKMDHITANNVTQHFEAVFHTEGEPLSATGRVRHEIVIPDDRVVYIKPRRYPQALMDVIRQELKGLLDQGIIRKSISLYCSPLWVVPKPPDAQGNLRHRVVVDYKELNKHTRSEKYPLPRLEDMLDRMNSASVFSILHLKAGYHQIRMHEADCEKTAFQFERGNYEFTRMPFGLKNAPTTFQRLMDEFLEGLDEGAIQVYMDDIIVFSRSEQEHGEHLVQLLRRLKEFGLKVSREKTLFFQSSVKLLGPTTSPWCGLAGLKDTSARVARWKERLAAYSFTISRNKGKDNVVADCLSRMVNALDAPTPSPGPSRRRPRINGSEDSPDVVYLPLLDHPEGESSIIPGLDLLRLRVVEEPDLPTVHVPASRETPSRNPEPDRRNAERRVMTWLSDTLDDKARQLVVRIISDTETPQMVIPTLKKPLEVIVADLVFLDGAIRLTLIDRLTRFAYDYPLQAKTGKRVREAGVAAIPLSRGGGVRRSRDRHSTVGTRVVRAREALPAANPALGGVQTRPPNAGNFTHARTKKKLKTREHSAPKRYLVGRAPPREIPSKLNRSLAPLSADAAARSRPLST
ncbi:hypothetical protein AAG570_007014 [Ranatra chinensis]|uniref:Reverse transcriptase domain-containing protein n=1 Tax=Ranatra chinensis TaxID=642074 RepID=A0ABD0Z687_9HEMI